MKVTLKSFLASVLLSFSLVAPVTPLLAQPPQTAAQQPTLYKRLGGYDALAAVTDDFLGRLTADTQLKRFFIGHNTEALKVIRQHIIDFLCQTTGGPCAYHGRDMKTAHTGLGITEDDWSAMVKDLTATFDKFKVPDKERGELLSAVSGLKADIVGK